ncbi:hypothetical protein HZH68_016330 [Vespula germanica]|uniref:Uncharacterized protein n=1 Tax=Vespula germanica TaxID=30212 RepID=A0A834MPY9_VESGE|nr:hypothetical protein HZH68_016330 [Vespula germanica]
MVHKPYLQQHALSQVSAAAIGHLCCQIGAELQRANDDNAANHPSLIGQGSLFNRSHTAFRRLLVLSPPPANNTKHLQTAATQCFIERNPIGRLHLKPEEERRRNNDNAAAPFAD